MEHPIYVVITMVLGGMVLLGMIFEPLLIQLEDKLWHYFKKRKEQKK